MAEIDLSSIQFKKEKDEDVQEKEAEKPDLEKVVKNAQKLKKEIHKEDEKIKEKEDEQQLIDKQKMILALQYYVLEFPDKLAEYKKKKYEKMSIDELKDLRKQFDLIISSKSSLKLNQKMIVNAINTLETIATLFTPIQCQGLGKLMTTDPDVLDDIKHISLKHLSLINVEPEYRLLSKTLTNVMMLHNINSSRETSNGKVKEKLTVVNNKYSDL